MATSKKSKAPSKTPAPKAHKPAPAKKPALADKHAKPSKPAHKPEPVKPAAKPVAPAPKAAPAPKSAPTPAPALKAKAAAPIKGTAPAAKTMSKADLLKQRILERRAAKPIAFTLDEAREVAKTNVGKAAEKSAEAKAANGKAKNGATDIDAKLKKAAQPHHVKTASLADILGYNPAKQAAPTALDPDSVDPKFQRYYKLLMELRDHVVNGLSTHTEQTLKRSSKEDSGDLSGYGQHMADAGTDTFDRDFALSLVSNEQEALAEIDAALKRIHAGTYGVCELTGKPIAKDRLLAVPFARFSVESQAEMERTRRRSSSRTGVFGELGEDGGKIEHDGGGGDE